MTSTGLLYTAAFAAVLVCGSGAAAAATYYVASDGDDANAGTSQAEPWRSLERVNRAELAPGDSVLFRRGDTWRGQLRPQSGAEGAVITYGAYGEGAKPRLLGSDDLASPDNWVQEREGVWATRPPAVAGASVLATWGTPDAPLAWSVYAEGGAQATMVPNVDGDVVVRCSASGTRGSDIQLIALGLTATEGTAMTLTFGARCTHPVPLAPPHLMKAGPPWSSYGDPAGANTLDLGPEWTDVIQRYVVTTTADDGRLTFAVGDTLPEGAELSLRDVRLTASDLTGRPLIDVGNIIFDDEASCGVKRFEEDELVNLDDYYFDETSCVLKLRSDANPGERHTRIECALRRHIIDQTNVSHVTYEDFCLLYGGAHGIGGANTHHITVRNLDIGYIGGGDQMGGQSTVRFGNGVEFWAGAHDCLVEGCRIWEVYDAALTNQSMGAPVVQRNITYRNNIIWNCEYSFEYWNRPAESVTTNIVFQNNTCYGAGFGWGHSQRPDPGGRHLCFYFSDAQAEDIIIRNNIFDLATNNAFYAPTYAREDRAGLVMDNNLWRQPEGTMILFRDGGYTQERLADYQAEQGMEPHSFVADPEFVDPEAGDFRLSPTSRCLAASMGAATLR